MNTATRFILLSVAVLMLFTGKISYGGSQAPQEQLKSTIDEAMAILSDKALKMPGKEHERRQLVVSVIKKRFDFNRVAQMCLGKHRRKLSKEELAEFTELFTHLLENNYIEKIEAYTNEKVNYLKTRITKNRAAVKTAIVTKNNEIALCYKMIKKKEKWWVYDVVIEGVSMVRNYRSQFNQIITRQSYQELVERLKSKQTEAEGNV